MKPREGYNLAKSLFGKEIDIPETWNVVTLAELSDGKPQYGSGDPALPYNSKLPRYIRITDIDDDGKLKSDGCVSANLINNETNLLEQDDFLFARTGSVGRTFVFSKEFGRCIYAGYLIRFRLNKQSIVPKFLHYYTHGASYWIWVTSELTQGVQPNLNAQQYSKLPVLLPPLPEQQRIASILSGIDALIGSTRKAAGKAELLKKGLMQELLTRGIGHTKFKAVKSLFGKEIEIPEGWDYQKFNKVVKTNPPTKIEQYIVPYIPMESVDTRKPHFNYAEERVLSKNSSLPKFQNNDVLFARITPSTENGKTSIVEDMAYGIASSELTVLRASKLVLPRYLYYYVKSDRIRRFAISQMMGTTGRQRVPNSVFKKDLSFELPPLPEQRRIASILSGVDAYIQKNRAYSEKLERLKKGLMQKLLTGQIRVRV